MFKLGDRVRMSCKGKETYPDSAYNPHSLIGKVIETRNDTLFPYRVQWENLKVVVYREHELELVTEVPMSKVVGKIKSDGGSTSYYDLPEHATELRHLISHKAMSKSRGDIFKACYRLGEKEGSDVLYDLNKMKFFIEDLIEMHKRGEHV